MAVLAVIGIMAVGKPSPPAVYKIRTREPVAATSVLTGSPSAVSTATAHLLLAAAPTVVVANEASGADVASAAAIAARVHAPLLLAAAGPLAAGLRAEIKALAPTAVLAVGLSAQAVAAGLPRIKVITTPRGLHRAPVAVPLRHVLVLVHKATSAAALAAMTTARVAGAQVVTLAGYDPRVNPGVIRAIAAVKPQRVVGIGAGFGPASRLGARVAVAATGVQLPGGGQVLFPMRRIVALYGNPQSSLLGALGEQDLPASIVRAERVAAQYRPLSRVPVIPAFEIIATVAEGSPGPTGSYSYEMPVADLRPWVQAATAAHMYVILDLQPGRDNFLAQAKRYEPLLKLPNVGLALDPEWKLQPGQVPLQQIGSVNIAEVNSVVTWLAALTARYHLPQKLLELHMFRLSMIQGEAQLDTRNDDLAIVVNMDGQGAPGSKNQTWAAITAAAPKGVFFGWKDFYVKDTPMMDPQETINHTPEPVLISYE